MMDILDKIKVECEKHGRCGTCALFDGDFCMFVDNSPENWDFEKIRKLFNNPVETKPVVVPKKLMANDAIVAPHHTVAVINEIIDCLQQIKERLE